MHFRPAPIWSRAVSRFGAAVASVDKGTHGFSRGKTTSGVVILVGGRQPACLVCLASRRLSSVKNSEGLAGRSGALSARQRTQTYWRMSRTITRQTAAQSGPQACVPLSTDAINGPWNRRGKGWLYSSASYSGRSSSSLVRLQEAFHAMKPPVSPSSRSARISSPISCTPYSL